MKARSACTANFWCIAMACALTACASLEPTERNIALEHQLASEIKRFVESDSMSPPAPCQVLFVGSSSIAFWKTLAQDMAPLPVINRGFGGSHVEYVNQWFDQIVAPYRPSAVVFYAGENDIAAGKSVRRVVADFETFMRHKRRVLGSVPVHFISLKPSILRDGQRSLQGEVNQQIRSLANRWSDLHYVDVVSPMLQDGVPRPVYMPDGLHMTAEGYAIWTGVLKGALLQQGGSVVRSCQAGR